MEDDNFPDDLDWSNENYDWNSYYVSDNEESRNNAFDRGIADFDRRQSEYAYLNPAAFIGGGAAVVGRGIFGRLGSFFSGLFGKFTSFTKGAVQITKARFGHTFTTHGQGATEFLTKRAAGSGKPMGQFLNDQAAAKLIEKNIGKLGQGAISVPAPKGFPARVIMPNGSFQPASSIRLVPGGKGVKTAYPEL